VTERACVRVSRTTERDVEKQIAVTNRADSISKVGSPSTKKGDVYVRRPSCPSPANSSARAAQTTDRKGKNGFSAVPQWSEEYIGNPIAVPKRPFADWK